MSTRSSARTRIRAVDLLRVVAALQMVEGHTIDALLAPAYRQGAGYQLWIALRGLTSVAFLFAAGLSFQLATLRDLERHLTAPGAVAARFGRAGMLVLLGYALRLPLPLPASDVELVAALEHSVAVDVLQCIGCSLAFVELLAVAVRRAVWVEAICGVLGTVILGASQLFAQLDPHGRYLPLLDYVSPRGGSQFPLVPWSAHMLLGVALARPLFTAERRGTRLAIGAGALRAAAVAAKLVGLTSAADHLGRLGSVVLLLLACELLGRWLRGELPMLTALSGETLFVYVFHVLPVYGRSLGLSDAVGPRLSPAAAGCVALFMIALCFGCALGYRRAWAGLAQSAATG